MSDSKHMVSYIITKTKAEPRKSAITEFGCACLSLRYAMPPHAGMKPSRGGPVTGESHSIFDDIVHFSSIVQGWI